MRGLTRILSAAALSVAMATVFMNGCSENGGNKAEGGMSGESGAMAAGYKVAAPLNEQEAKELATAAYIYAYPLITMDTTRQVMTAVPKFDPVKLRAPMFQFANASAYPTAAFKDVTAPNADTLYSSAWVDVGKQPWVLHIPEMGDRYYLFPMLDAWTTVFADPGKRLGVTGGDFAITGPGWAGQLPAGVRLIQAPTNMVWILGRTYCTGTPEDYAAVHVLQADLSLTPLSAWGTDYRPPAEVPMTARPDVTVDTTTPPREQVNATPAGEYFAKLAMLMGENPPAEADGPMVARLARLGIVAGQPYDLSSVDPAIARGITDGQKAGLEKIVGELGRLGKKVNGWQITFTGEYGTDYLFRAAIAYAGLGANRPEDACYPSCTVDSEGQPLDGSRYKYVWHFASKMDLPPANGFWSLTMYNDQYFFVENPLNRYTLSQRDDLKVNMDGSIDMYLQKDNPGPEKEANWLPAADGRFVLMLRVYWPKLAFLGGEWVPPGVKRVE